MQLAFIKKDHKKQNKQTKKPPLWYKQVFYKDGGNKVEVHVQTSCCQTNIWDKG